MKKGKKIVIGIVAAAVVAGGVYLVNQAAQEEKHSFPRFPSQKLRQEMWRKS